MRTTVTLDPDVAAKLKAVARERGISFKQALNQAVRAGLGASRRPAPSFEPYTQPMGLRPGLSLDKALGLAAAFEDDETVRRLEVRK
ncbi:MAG: CopG family transcriptional regulator [Candidatus Rokuibacteriota bacterium]